MKDSRDRNTDDDVVQLQLRLLQLVLDVDVAAALSVVRWPTVDWRKRKQWWQKGTLVVISTAVELTRQWYVGLVRGLESPLENAHVCV